MALHAVYLCPQLFRYESHTLVPSQGKEIAELIARSVQAGAVERCPWYDGATATGAIIRPRQGNAFRKSLVASRRSAVVGRPRTVERSFLIHKRHTSHNCLGQHSNVQSIPDHLAMSRVEYPAPASSAPREAPQRELLYSRGWAAWSCALCRGGDLR